MRSNLLELAFPLRYKKKLIWLLHVSIFCPFLVAVEYFTVWVDNDIDYSSTEAWTSVHG
jgi:hypothetical protein